MTRVAPVEWKNFFGRLEGTTSFKFGAELPAASAVFDALGVRVRDLPITRDRIIAAMELSS